MSVSLCFIILSEEGWYQKGSYFKENEYTQVYVGVFFSWYYVTMLSIVQITAADVCCYAVLGENENTLT